MRKFVAVLLLCSSFSCGGEEEPKLGSGDDAGTPVQDTGSAGEDAGGVTDMGRTDSGAPDLGVEPCGANERALNGACAPCPAGSTNAEGDDPAAGDSECDATLCGEGEYVSSNVCTTCAPGTERQAGDDATGADTQCDAILCETDEYVASNACVMCESGTTNMAGDDASGADTACDAELCPSNWRVLNNVCERCPSGTTNEAGDDATGADTSCDPVFCPVDNRVVGNACLPCQPGATNEAGDDASGADTQCEPTICGENERVSSYTCVPCAQGLTRPAGDNATGPDTACSDTCQGPLGVSCTEFEAAYLKGSNTENFDYFGYTVSVDGNTVVVGAPQEGSDSNMINGTQGNGAGTSGAVYVYVRSNGAWSQEAYIKPSDNTQGARFGTDVDIDGDTLIVGALLAGGPGQAYVFRRTGTTWTEQGILSEPTSIAGEGFGEAVSVSGDTVVVGAPRHTVGGVGFAGAAFVYRWNGSLWAKEASLGSTTAQGSAGFGWDVAIEGDTLVAGSISEHGATTQNTGIVYVFTRAGTTWSLQQTIEASNSDRYDGFGRSVAISADTLLVGAAAEDSNASGVGGDASNNGLSSSGAAYVFTRTNGVWTEQAYLKAPQPDGNDAFGWRVALDGDMAAVTSWLESSSATGVNGDATSNAAAGAGAAYLFQRSAGVWTPYAYVKASNTDPDDAFGQSVALDGRLLVVGAHQESSAATGIDGDEDDDTARNAGAAYIRLIAP